MSVTILDAASHKPPEASCRTTTRRYVCTQCIKCVDRVIVPGVIDNLTNCTLTENCNGTLTMDKNSKPTSVTELTYWINNPTVKAEFRTQRIVTVIHNFGHVGSVIVDVFLYAISGGKQVEQKTTNFKIVKKTKTEITIELLESDFKPSGKIVLTDNQYINKTTQQTSASNAVTLTSNSIFTIALDYYKDTAFAPGSAESGVPVDNGLVLTAQARYITQSKQYQASDGIVNHQFNFYCHASNHYSSVVAASAFSTSRILVTGKPYYLYSAEIPGDLISQRGASVIIDLSINVTAPNGTSSKMTVDGFIPYVTGTNTRASDICTTSLIYLNHLKIGDIISDGKQWIVGNNTVISTINPPLLKI